MFLRKSAIAALAVCLAMPALAQDAAPADPAKGEKVYRKCKACHEIGDGAKNKVGPPLTGIVGAEIASAEGFKYSKAFMEKKATGFVWTEEELDLFMTKPKDHTKGTKMSFAGLKKDADRANIIAYLKTF